MKKPIILSIALCAAFSAAADFNGAGYYRLQNYKTERWASMIDNKGSIDMAGNKADLQAIQLQKNFDEVCCDPASIVYIRPAGSQYQIEAQGTGIYEMIGHYLNIKETGSANGNKLYYATGTYDGFEKYVGDNNPFPKDITSATTNANGDYRKWFIHPMDTDGANFFGVRPTVAVGSRRYGTVFGAFPLQAYSEGVKIYAIKQVGAGMALMEEVTGPVAKSTPVIVECPTENPSDNRLQIGVEGSAVADNILSGAYYCSTEKSNHLNYTTFDPQTMRVLGVCSDGSLGFVTPADLKYIPANTAYLKVAPGTPAELRCVDREAFTADVDGVEADSDAPVDVYNVAGVIVLRRATRSQIDALPAGLYIAGGKKILIRR